MKKNTLSISLTKEDNKLITELIKSVPNVETPEEVLLWLLRSADFLLHNSHVLSEIKKELSVIQGNTSKLIAMQTKEESEISGKEGFIIDKPPLLPPGSAPQQTQSDTIGKGRGGTSGNFGGSFGGSEGGI